MFKRKALILAVIEAVYGTLPAITGANAINVSDLSIEPAAGTMKKRNLIQPGLGTQAGIITEKHQVISFKLELKGAGTGGLIPECGPVLRACSFSQVQNIGTDVVYTLVSESFESCALTVNMDGILHTLVGCRGNAVLDITAGEFPTISVSMLALYAAPVDGAAATPTYSPVLPLEVNAANTQFTLDGYAAKLQKMSCDPGVKYKYRERPNSSAEIIINGERDSKGNIAMDAVLLATKNYFTTWADNTLVAMSLTHGTTDGNTVSIAADKVQLGTVKYGDDDGILSYDLPVGYTKNSSGNEVTITFA